MRPHGTRKSMPRSSATAIPATHITSPPRTPKRRAQPCIRSGRRAGRNLLRRQSIHQRTWHQHADERQGRNARRQKGARRRGIPRADQLHEIDDRPYARRGPVRSKPSLRYLRCTPASCRRRSAIATPTPNAISTIFPTRRGNRRLIFPFPRHSASAAITPCWRLRSSTDRRIKKAFKLRLLHPDKKPQDLPDGQIP